MKSLHSIRPKQDTETTTMCFKDHIIKNILLSNEE